jgi:hypothetical protein
VSVEPAGTPAGLNWLIRRLPLLAFCLLAVMTVGAFFITQKLKAAKPVVWGNPHPVPSTFDPVGGRVCHVHGRSFSYRTTRIHVSPTQAGRVAVYVYAVGGSGPIATISSGRLMPQGSYNSNHPYNWFTWNGRRQNGQLAPQGKYYFKLVLRQLDNHEVDLTNEPVDLITSAHPLHGGCLTTAQ